MHTYPELATHPQRQIDSRDTKGDLRISRATSEISLDTTEQLDSVRPNSKRRRDHLCTLLLVLLWIGGVLLVIDVVVVPGLFYGSGWVRRNVVFNTFLSETNLNPVGGYDFVNGTEFVVDTEDGVALGAWQLPTTSSTNLMTTHRPDEDDVVVLYFHGGKGNRAATHSVGLYRVLNSLNLNVVTFDYRGYGDSTGEPSADGVVKDAIAVYDKLRATFIAQRIILWGESMGAWVALKLVEEMKRRNEQPLGVVLQAPFDHVANAFATQPLTSILRLLPCFDEVYIDSLKADPVTDMDTKRILPQIGDVPFLVLHAEDDRVVPFELGVEVYKTLMLLRLGKANNTTYIDNEGRIAEGTTPAEVSVLKPDPIPELGLTFVGFNKSLGYGHTGLFAAPQLPTLIQEFVTAAKQKQ